MRPAIFAAALSWQHQQLHYCTKVASGLLGGVTPLYAPPEALFYDAQGRPDNKVQIEVVQAGINPDHTKDEFPAIKLERTNATKLMHKDGTISMARDGPDTATSDFFLCIGDQPELDFGGKRNPDGQGFAAFGRVVKGMDVVKKIQAAAAEGQTLKPPVKIVKVVRKS